MKDRKNEKRGLRLYIFTDRLLGLGRNEDEAREEILRQVNWHSGVKSELEKNPPTVISKPFGHIVWDVVRNDQVPRAPQTGLS